MRAIRTTVAVSIISAVGLAGFVTANSNAASATESPGSPPAKATATAKVTRQDLVQTETHDGTLQYGGARAVNAGNTGTVTGLAAEGATVNRGGALYAVNESAVRLMFGSVPAYRDLGPGVADGRDVRQLEANLKALGFADDDLEIDDDWTAATTRSVKEWQEARGVAETGRIPLGSVVFLSGPVRVGEHKAAAGDAVQPGTPVLEVTSTSREVTVDLAVDDAAIASLKENVTIELGNGRTAKGTVSAIAAVAHSSGTEENSDTVIPVTVSLSTAEARKLGSLDNAPVEVVFEKSRAKNVLTVPVTALVALAEGGYAVEVQEATGTRLVGVEAGEFANGRVEVSGDGIAESTSVVVPA